VDIDFGEDAPIVGGAAGNGQDQGQPADSPAARASAITGPREIPKPVEPPPPPPDPKAKRRKRIRVFALVFVVLLLLAGGGVATWVVVNKQYFVGEAEDGEIAIFQGVRGSVFGVSLNRQVQGSCDPTVPTCDKFYVDDLKELGRETVREGTESFDNIPDARQFIRDLRTKYPLPPCETLRKAAERQATPTNGTPTPGTTTTTTTKAPGRTAGASPTTTTTGPATGTTTTGEQSDTEVEPKAGVNCRERREGGG
jgi:protein phosphatase